MKRLLAILICSVLLGGAAFADEVYTYTGAPLAQFNDPDNVCAPCSITGSFTTAEPLPDNARLFTANWYGQVGVIEPPSPIESFSFTDGAGLTLTQAESSEWVITTNAVGAIVSWTIAISFPNSILPNDQNGAYAFAILSGDGGTGDKDWGVGYYQNDDNGWSYEPMAFNGTAGSWTMADPPSTPICPPDVPLGQTPEPGTFGLLAIGAVGILWKAARG